MSLNHLDNFDQWDDFIKNSLRGHYSQYSEYLKSYLVYGADYKVFVAKIDNKIIGGIGCVLLGKLGFKIISVPAGPIIAEGYEYIFKDLINLVIDYAVEHSYTMLQVSPLSHVDYKKPYLLPSIELPIDRYPLHNGLPFRLTPIPNQLFLIDLMQSNEGKSWEETMLASFDRHARRRIKKSTEFNLEFKEVTNKDDVKEAYDLFVTNGETQGYKTRSWDDYGEIVMSQISKKQARVFIVTHNGELLTSHYGLIAGQRYYYVLGGTKRTEVDYSAGHFLHWNIMKIAKEMKLEAYDFGSVGSQGVLRFKKSFKPERTIFDEPQYYVFSKSHFYLLKKLFPVMKKYKSQFAFLAKSFKLLKLNR